MNGGYIYGVLFAAAVIILIEVVRFRRWSKKLDRQFELEVYWRDQEREAGLRANGVSEEDIAELSAKINEARKESDARHEAGVY